ncbi:MAG: HAMP domain-containing sensor histidine kinase [Deinococcales bacterium]
MNAPTPDEGARGAVPTPARGSLFWRLLPSYLLVIVVAAAAAFLVGETLAPFFLRHHMDEMMAALGSRGSMGMGGGLAGMGVDLSEAYRRALTQSLTWASLLAALAATGVALYVTGRIVTPLRDMTRASERIAGGRYGDRLDPHAPGEVGELAAAFNRMADTLQRSEERRVELLADVAHEFRTPLSNLRGYVEGLEDGVFDNAAGVFEASRRQLDRLTHLVDDLSLLSRVETGQLELELAPVDARSLVDASAAAFLPEAGRRGIRLEAVAPHTALWVHADRERTLQVLSNLIGNALRYTPRGGSVRLEVAPASRSEVRFAVRDTGPGIAPEDLPNVFKRFYRGDKARSPHAGGSGIGLTLARQLVERQGGTISVVSPRGEGATFTFTLPQAREARGTSS